jgi:Rod binding domain-containing protein
MKIDSSVATLKTFEPNKITATDDDKKLKEQTDNFESFMVKKVLDIALKHENSLFGKDAGDKIYNSMYNDTMSKALSGGMGYSELLFNFLKEGQATTTNPISPAELVPSQTNKINSKVN